MILKVNDMRFYSTEGDDKWLSFYDQKKKQDKANITLALPYPIEGYTIEVVSQNPLKVKIVPKKDEVLDLTKMEMI